jgi:hypothetical protein
MTSFRSRPLTRRAFLADTGMGLTGLVLGQLLAREQPAAASPAPDARPGPHFAPKAKSVIWIFLCGGVSQMESFDPKPTLDKYAGKKISETPFDDALKDEKNPFALKLERGAERLPLFPTQCTFQRCGQAGTSVSEFFPHIGACVDDLAVVRSFWTSSVFHSAQLQFHTGRQPREVGLPTIGSWVAYGLGSLNASLPEYVVLGTPTGSCCGGEGGYGAGYLGPAHGGVRINLGSKNPLPYLVPEDSGVLPEERAAQLQTLGKLNRLAGVEYPDDPVLQARIQSYELAARMQTSVPETLDLGKESAETQRLYGLDQSETRTFGTLCLSARRLVERGVRFVQVFHGSGGFGPWDAHEKLRDGHGKAAREVDRPIAGLVRDLQQRGLSKEVVVVCGTEFGRTPTTGGSGREHSPFGFTCWLSGAGIKGGVVHGGTDELGYHAVEDRHYITDLHATIMHLLGLDSRRLEIPGRRRLDIDHGTPIEAILA